VVQWKLISPLIELFSHQGFHFEKEPIEKLEGDQTDNE
jgi:hypothetical protein